LQSNGSYSLTCTPRCVAAQSCESAADASHTVYMHFRRWSSTKADFDLVRVNSGRTQIQTLHNRVCEAGPQGGSGGIRKILDWKHFEIALMGKIARVGQPAANLPMVLASYNISLAISTYKTSKDVVSL